MVPAFDPRARASHGQFEGCLARRAHSITVKTSWVGGQVISVVKQRVTCFALELHFMDLFKPGPLSETPRVREI